MDKIRLITCQLERAFMRKRKATGDYRFIVWDKRAYVLDTIRRIVHIYRRSTGGRRRRTFQKQFVRWIRCDRKTAYKYKTCEIPSPNITRRILNAILLILHRDRERHLQQANNLADLIMQVQECQNISMTMPEIFDGDLYPPKKEYNDLLNERRHSVKTMEKVRLTNEAL